jgi:hypothetical protein
MLSILYLIRPMQKKIMLFSRSEMTVFNFYHANNIEKYQACLFILLDKILFFIKQKSYYIEQKTFYIERKSIFYRANIHFLSSNQFAPIIQI